MVRKRSRTARKYYDDDNDSDSDFALEDAPSEPAQKKYSLRQRKRRLFTEFEFDDDGDEIEPTKVPSDDDDFEVEKELELGETPNTEYIDNETYENDFEPDNEDMPEGGDGLIDFEDMIRADIVVNKNRIDYDNIIQKTEIKVQPIQEIEQPIIKSKRGRKPKARPEGEIDSSLLEPETEMHETEFDDKDDKDYNPLDDADIDEPIDCAKLMHAELSECANEISDSILANDINCEPDIGEDKIPHNEIAKTQEEDIKSDSFESTNISQDPVVETNENNSSNLNQDSMWVNGKVSPPICPPNFTTEKLLPVSKVDIVEVDDDDVVLVEDEKKCEVIVLDD